ncbi:uncharacterized protein LOC125047012 [Penaeus chinensis]|uniref:uncharacterized protein LOC125047012 n=1 Tax=Penaeus chinensis TaxID=139456 RepID=UPI001FB6C8FB|nr:uncharacterized protein LOC125047012 [Penaeus chinensis]
MSYATEIAGTTMSSLGRYTDEGVPVEVMLLDLQLVRLASLATDLNYLLHTSLKGQTRRDNLSSFLSAYYQRFSQVLGAGGCAVPFSLQDLTPETAIKDEPYEVLKTALLSRLESSITTRLQELLLKEELGNEKPSDLLRRMKKLFVDKSGETWRPPLQCPNSVRARSRRRVSRRRSRTTREATLASSPSRSRNAPRKETTTRRLLSELTLIFQRKTGCYFTSYIVKCDPRRIKVLQDFTYIGFQKELVFYQQLVHELQLQLQDAGQTPLKVPRCFYTSFEENREVIFLEDLGPKGFKMSDRKVGVDAAHTKLILEELAGLHAASYLLKAKIPDLNKKYPILNLDWLTYADNARRSTQGLFSDVMDTASKLLHHIGGYEGAVAWLDKNKLRAAELIENELRSVPPFDVLCHGDCWINNVLFRYADEGVPVEVMLLDLQLVRLASLATDLNYLLHTSLKGQTRRDNLSSFLSAYYQRFSQVLAAGGSAVPFSLQDLTQEYKNHLTYGLITGLLAVVFGLRGEEGLNDSDGKADLQDKRKDHLIRAMTNQPNIRDKLVFLIDEMIENGIIT